MTEPDVPTEARARATSAVRTVVSTGVVVAVIFAVIHRCMEHVLHAESTTGDVVEVVLMALVTCTLLWLGVLRPLHRRIDAERAAATARQDELAAAAAQQAFEGEVHRGLEMAETEEMSYRATEKALRLGVPTVDAELLLADSSDAHLKRVLAVGGSGLACCDVAGPHSCPAIRRAQTLTFSSSERIDACPHLDGRAAGPLSATCVPVSVGGRSIGVLHTAAPLDSARTTSEVARLEAVATLAGARIGMLRVMSATMLQAATDPLTGLLNRRSVENSAHDLLRRGTPLAFAVADLDHFKRVNDTFGHEAGDRALRLFARTLHAAVRTDDLVSRYGGEEFVVVLPGLDIVEAELVLGRVQEALVLALAEGTVPHFTASFGLAHTEHAPTFQRLYQLADAALLSAKRAGRNRVVTATSLEGVAG